MLRVEDVLGIFHPVGNVNDVLLKVDTRKCTKVNSAPENTKKDKYLVVS